MAESSKCGVCVLWLFALNSKIGYAQQFEHKQEHEKGDKRKESDDGISNVSTTGSCFQEFFNLFCRSAQLIIGIDRHGIRVTEIKKDPAFRALI